MRAPARRLWGKSPQHRAATPVIALLSPWAVRYFSRVAVDSPRAAPIGCDALSPTPAGTRTSHARAPPTCAGCSPPRCRPSSRSSLTACSTAQLPELRLHAPHGVQPRSRLPVRHPDLARDVVFVFVEGILLYTILRYRRRSENDRPEHVHGNTTLEILWTAIPAAHPRLHRRAHRAHDLQDAGEGVGRRAAGAR